MPYVTLADLAGKIPPAFAIQAMDDDGDGEIDAGVWETIARQVGEEIEGTLGQRYATPFTEPFPAIVKTAALIFALEVCYERRGVEKNPWSERAKALRMKLDRIAQGEEPLTPNKQREKASGTLIEETSRTFSSQGRRL